MPTFSPAGEKDVTRAIVESYMEQFDEYVESDVIIVGAGPAGLSTAKALAENDVKTIVLERNNYLGGGFWLGGFLMNKLTARAPAQEIWDEQGVDYEEYEGADDLFIADAPHACSAAIKDACEAGAVFQNMTEFQDLVVREQGAVRGAVINWSPVSALPREITCVDPIAIESKILVDATGHQAEPLTKLHERGYVNVPGFEDSGIRTFEDAQEYNTHAGHDSPAHDSMWVEKSEDAVVEHTGKVHDGLFLTGMSVCTAFGLPRMGPTFGGMLISGRRCAEQIIAELDGEDVQTLDLRARTQRPTATNGAPKEAPAKRPAKPE